jgi:hypothetical protein
MKKHGSDELICPKYRTRHRNAQETIKRKSEFPATEEANWGKEKRMRP